MNIEKIKMSFETPHPRPDFARNNHWVSLNGEWGFKFDPTDVGVSEKWFLLNQAIFEQSILVPFAWETELSGINQEWQPIGWYHLRIDIPEEWKDKNSILHFGAVFYKTQVWCNGEYLGENIGGYHPFEFDLTGTLDGNIGEIIVRVEAPLDKRFIPHGKQRSQPADDYNDCAFTASSGIWQTVWLENRPATFIKKIQLRSNDELNGFRADISLEGPNQIGAFLNIKIPGIYQQKLLIDSEHPPTIQIPIQNAHLWQPDDPYLYEIEFILETQSGLDEVSSYTGLRKFETYNGKFLLNGKQIFMRGALDQGYWPRSGYTAPDDQTLRADVEIAIQAGFNLIRKHIKLEDPRWLYWADKYGLLVWAEPPCTGRYSEEAINLFEMQLPEMVMRDGNHPSIVLWGIYNEEWGFNWNIAENHEMQNAVIRAYDLLSSLDQSRPIIDNSGWWHVKTDVLDWHYYDENMVTWKQTCEDLANKPDSWFGHSLSDTRWYDTKLWVPGYEQTNKPIMNGEYGGGSLENQGWLFRWQTQDLLRHSAFSGYIYTELYDVEHEVVGLYTAERELKDLDCNPIDINVEIALCFDILPLRPGMDLQSLGGKFVVPVNIANHGNTNVIAHLQGHWKDLKSGLISKSIEVFAHTISQAINVHDELPSDLSSGRFILELIDKNGKVIASNFLDVGR